MRDIGRLALWPGALVTTSDTSPGQGAKPRFGVPTMLPYRKADFKSVLSQPKTFERRSSALEAAGLVLDVRWGLRSRRQLSKRVVILVDA